MSKVNKIVNQECVKVIVRCRPMSEKEMAEGYRSVVHIFPARGIIDIKNPKMSDDDVAKQFTFDAVYDCNSKQQELYDETFRPLVDSVLNGFNGTIFAYGQTGTGKTYTMEGLKNDPEHLGVIPNSFEHVFNHITRSQNKQYLVRASYLEIYQEEVRDLLSKDQTKRLELKERPDTGVYVKDLSNFVCKSSKEIEHVMTVGNQNRSTGYTNMNEHSSRSHAIFMITVECCETSAEAKNNRITVGKLNLVDLAGSERQTKSGTSGERLKEATKINLSLSALGNVISALVDGKSSHIPYRDSKLTRLLQDSLGGNAKTIMVANIGPASYNYDESLTTLRYASRAKNIKNKPHINEDPKDALLREFQQEILRLKAQLSARSGKTKHKKKCEDTENEDGDSEGSIIAEQSEEEYLTQNYSLLEEQKTAILNNHNLIAEEKDKLLSELEKKQELFEKENENRDKLSNKIKALESKLLSGGKNIVDHTNEQQRELEQRRQEIAEQKRVEREMQQKLESHEESEMLIKETYSSLQQEVEIKTRKLKKLFAKLQSVKQEIQDLQEEHSRERQDLEQTQNELTRELKLKYLIIENFIPLEHKNKTLQRIVYDEDEDQWRLNFINKSNNSTLNMKRPISAAGSRRPVSEFAKLAAANGSSTRYKGENILAVELDMPCRTTRDYDGPAVNPNVQAALNAALKGEEDIDIDASFLVVDNKIKAIRKDKILSGKSKIPKTTSIPCTIYPQSRGLVPK